MNVYFFLLSLSDSKKLEEKLSHSSSKLSLITIQGKQFINVIDYELFYAFVCSIILIVINMIKSIFQAFVLGKTFSTQMSKSQ